MNGDVFKILTVDGGGIRGVFPAHILSCLSKKIGVTAHDHFNMIAGTSTGSIIAAAIACNIDPDKVVSLYRDHGSLIFTCKKSWYPSSLKPAFHSIYEANHFRDILKDVFGEIRLGDIKLPLLLPATDIGSGGVHVFKSNYSSDFTRDLDVLIRDAVLASCSAPTYFDPTKVGPYVLSDGGLWANNPSLAAVIDAQHRLKIELANVRVLSLGTGTSKTCYGVNLNKGWGLMRGWKGREFISFIMSLQAQSTHNYLQLILKEDQLLRLDFESEKPLPLDDCSAIDDLVSRADKLFTHGAYRVRSL